MMDSTEETYKEKLILLEILQPVRATEEATDIYLGDNKLIELRHSTFGGT